MSQQDNLEVNLTPVLDMVFQLITFFMLVVNFRAASLDLNLDLPVVGSALPPDNNASPELLVLNLDADGKLLVFGKDQPDIKGFISKEAQVALRTAKVDHPEMKLGDELPITVVVRADRAIPFHLLNSVIRTCQDQGFRKFYYRAMSKAET